MHCGIRVSVLLIAFCSGAVSEVFLSKLFTMATEHQYFYEDEVFRINKRGNIEYGMVLENSELVSSDENSDGEEGGRMKQGHIRVAWHPSGEEEVIQEKKVCRPYP